VAGRYKWSPEMKRLGAERAFEIEVMTDVYWLATGLKSPFE
jgi:hypothetical protein